MFLVRGVYLYTIYICTYIIYSIYITYIITVHMYTEYIIYTSCRIIREASTRVNIPAVKAAQEFEIHDKPVEQACPEDTTGCTEMGTGKNDHMFFLFKSP